MNILLQARSLDCLYWTITGQAVRIQSALREAACEENSRGLKISIVSRIAESLIET